MFRFGWAASLTGRRRTECTSEDRKAKQTAKDGYFRHAADRPREKLKKHISIKKDMMSQKLLTNHIHQTGG